MLEDGCADLLKEFQEHGRCEKSKNASFIMQIPKKSDAKNSKIFALLIWWEVCLSCRLKVLANRLQSVLGKLIVLMLLLQFIWELSRLVRTFYEALRGFLWTDHPLEDNLHLQATKENSVLCLDGGL